MTLSSLLYDIDEMFQRSKEYLEPYMYIYEVRNFIERRELDLERFKNIVAGYSLAENILTIQQDIRLRFPNESKLFGGICLNGKEYFRVTKKVQKTIDDELESLQEQAYEEMMRVVDEENEHDIVDGSFAIPDELDEETFDELYGQKGTD